MSARYLNVVSKLITEAHPTAIVLTDFESILSEIIKSIEIQNYSQKLEQGGISLEQNWARTFSAKWIFKRQNSGLFADLFKLNVDSAFI